jgi:hypothetical protein
VGYVQIKRENDVCIVRARICPEHRVRNKPYLVVSQIKESDRGNSIISTRCMDCTASAGK